MRLELSREGCCQERVFLVEQRKRIGPGMTSYVSEVFQKSSAPKTGYPVIRDPIGISGLNYLAQTSWQQAGQRPQRVPRINVGDKAFEEAAFCKGDRDLIVVPPPSESTNVADHGLFD